MRLEELQNILKVAQDMGHITHLVNPNMRDFEFVNPRNECSYKINWWCNICYLDTECGAHIPFHKLEFSGTWLNHFKVSMQFYYNKEVCCIIPVKEYDR